MTPVCRCCCCCCCCQRQREEKGVSLLVSPRTKNTPEDWKRTRFCARTHTKKKQGHAYSLLLCCVIGTRRSIDFARWSIVTFWLARGGFVGPMIRERPTSRSLFFRSDFFLMHDAPQSFPLLFDRFKTRSRRRKRQTNSRRAREKTRKTHTHREEEEEDKEEKKQRRRTRVLLDFRFHPSVQSVVERFQKRRPVHVSSRFGCRRRRRQRRDRRRARDRFLQATIIRAAFFAAAAHDDDVSRPSCSLLYRERESFEEILIGL